MVDGKSPGIFTTTDCDLSIYAMMLERFIDWLVNWRMTDNGSFKESLKGWINGADLMVILWMIGS